MTVEEERTAAGVLRVLDVHDLDEALAVCARDPVANVFVASRLRACGLDRRRLGAEVWGWGVGGRLQSLCHAGANLVPVQATFAAVEAFAERARRQGRRCSSIVGPAHTALALWSAVERSWSPAREVRADQPVMVCDSDPAVAADPAVRRVRPDELPTLLPAAIAMFTEEVGLSPLGSDGGAAYRARVAELIADGRSWARFDGDRVTFKAEVGAVADGVCQVQGVWVHPDLRGRGMAAPGMAAVVTEARRDVAPLVTLYVNAWNRPARSAYRRVGFRDAGTFASVLF